RRDGVLEKVRNLTQTAIKLESGVGNDALIDTLMRGLDYAVGLYDRHPEALQERQDYRSLTAESGEGLEKPAPLVIGTKQQRELIIGVLDILEDMGNRGFPSLKEIHEKA